MKKIFSFVFMICAGYSVSMAQQSSEMPELNPESCTSIMVGRQASTDGSVITSHTCDSNYRTWMDIVAGSHSDKDTTVNVYTGRMHTEYNKGSRGMKLKGTVPFKDSHFYQFLNTAYPCLNEKQLGMGETTIEGREMLVNPNGMFQIEELQRIALQRCTTARQAIRLMGELIEKYGYGDWGECLTIADTKEVWHFEVFGEGKKKVGGVWAAVRIPDDHVGVSANYSRISTIHLDDPDNCMASKNVFSVAKRLGIWDGKKPFRFWEAYGGTYTYGLKAFGIREYFILNKLAPSLHLSYDAVELPISVKPDKKVSATDVMALLSETYEGTEYDMTKNLKVAVKNKTTQQVDSIISPIANPWMPRDMVNMLNAQNPNAVKRLRLVAVPQCAYSTVIQLRGWLPDAVGGVVWMSFDNPGQSPRIPIFSGTADLPACFKICGQHRYRDDAAVWTFRRANKLATVRWGLTKGQIQSGMAHFVEKGQMELPYVEKRYQDLLKAEGEEKASLFLTEYTADFAGAALLRWKDLGDTFWSKFARSF